VLAWQLCRAGEADRRAAHRLFAFSIVYLFVLFAALLASNGADRWPSNLSARVAPTDIEQMHAGSAGRPLRIARSATFLSSDEV
jgi:heme o synthase